MRQNSPWLPKINRAINTAISDGLIQESYRRHLRHRCTALKRSSQVQPLGLSNLGFLFIAAGLITIVLVVLKVCHLLMRKEEKQKSNDNVQFLPGQLLTRSSISNTSVITDITQASRSCSISNSLLWCLDEIPEPCTTTFRPQQESLLAQKAAEQSPCDVLPIQPIRIAERLI